MYHAALGRFISRDPIGYVDGMSLYRAYFVPGALDPEGTRKVCCGLQRGWFLKESFGRTAECRAGISPVDCCKARFNRGWWTPEFKVLRAVEGACDAIPGPKLALGVPTVILSSQAQTSIAAGSKTNPASAGIVLGTVIAINIVTAGDTPIEEAEEDVESSL